MPREPCGSRGLRPASGLRASQPRRLVVIQQAAAARAPRAPRRRMIANASGRSRARAGGCGQRERCGLEWVVGLLMALVVVAVAPLAACKASSASRDAASRGGASAEAREVQVVPATEDRLVRAITVTGTLAAEEQVTLSMKVTGRLKELLRRPRQPRDPRPGAGAADAHRLQPARKPVRGGAAAGARAPGPARAGRRRPCRSREDGDRAVRPRRCSTKRS